jgi:hypothetical protein
VFVVLHAELDEFDGPVGPEAPEAPEAPCVAGPVGPDGPVGEPPAAATAPCSSSLKIAAYNWLTQFVLESEEHSHHRGAD